jgi:cyclopropane fatty-acyl-phospholipid synthase-like methyltransferase
LDGGRRITSMPLYMDVHRINNELAELGIGPDQPLTPEQLFPFDQFHYLGTDAVRAAAGSIGLGRASRVLEVGSGLGGPARYLAHTVGCHVTALELQEELHALASTLTRRCGLEAHVAHVRGDALTYPLPDREFDAVVSWLAIHHIRPRPRLLARLAAALRPGGRIYIEDLVVRAPFSPGDAEAVRRMLYGETMTSVDDYVADVVKAGFVDIEITDMTPGWAVFCQGRAAAFSRSRERHERVHGPEIAARLETFFSTVDRLFASGSLGGVRLTAHRPPEHASRDW